MLEKTFDVAVNHPRDRDSQRRRACGGLCTGSRECNEQDRRRGVPGRDISLRPQMYG